MRGSRAADRLEYEGKVNRQSRKVQHYEEVRRWNGGPGLGEVATYGDRLVHF